VYRIVDRPLTREEATAISTWAYEPPYDVYNAPGDEAIATFLARDGHGWGYYAVLDAADSLVGFGCFGPEARVRGQVEEPGTADIGMGLRPDTLGQGVGSELLPQLLRFAREHFDCPRARTAVAAFNERSQRMCLAAGFTATGEFTGPGDRPFLELTR
jgi:[ribosomal protein S18]-alanine N-acetyltransferase